MARAVVNNAAPKQLSEIKILDVDFDIEHATVRVTVEYFYDDGSTHGRRVLQTEVGDAISVRDFFLVFRTATSLNDLEVKTLEFFQSQLGDVTVEA